jgi:choline dehydrogenase
VHDHPTLPMIWKTRNSTDVVALTQDPRQSSHFRTTSLDTCAIGQGQESVVDHMLRVRGIDGMRVADASVMPVIPHGNTNAPTIMIAERAADLVCGVSTPP